MTFARTSKVIHAYTDYPFEALGDTSGQPAPFRKVRVLSYDGNKYCEVLVEYEKEEGYTWHHYDSIKSFYIYSPLAEEELELIEK